eukprot:gene30016-47417_t
MGDKGGKGPQWEKGSSPRKGPQGGNSPRKGDAPW